VETAHPRPERLAHALNRRQRDAGPTCAQEHRTHGDVQAREGTRRQEMRDRDTAAFDEEPPEAAAPELLQHGVHPKHTVAAGYADHLTARPRVAWLGARRSDHDRSRLAVVEHFAGLRYAQQRVDDDTHWVMTGYQARGQLWIVVHDRAGAHQHGVR